MEQHTFDSQGTRCSGVLYRPRGTPKPPVIVMGHGLGALKEFRLPAFAERFVEQGLAAFLFDYRYHGESDGEPRGLINPFRQLTDWHAAIDYVKSLPDLSNRQPAVWGSSFGGGHVLAVAAARKDISCVVSQIPFVSGLSSLGAARPGDLLEALLKGSVDLFRSLLKRGPYYIPLIGRPDEFAVMKTEECYDGYLSIVPQDADWSNRCPARLLFYILAYNPKNRAKRIQCPVLLLGARKDSLVPLEGIRGTATRLKTGRLELLDCNHFQAYTGDYFEKVVAIESEFLLSHLS